MVSATDGGNAGNGGQRRAWLVQLLLPLRDADGAPFAAALFAAVRGELTERFGGTTAFLRSPATGLWEDARGDVQRDEVVLVEVLVDALDRAWWAGYRRSLETRFAQDEVLVRAVPVERL